MATTAEKPVRGRPKTLERDHVLSVAMMSYWTDGPTSVSMNEICQRACVSKPGLYREFGSEDGLKQAVLAAYRTMALTPLYELLEVDQPFDQGLEALTRYILQEREALGLPLGCLHVEMCQNRGQFGAQTIHEIDLFQQQMLDRYAGWVDRAKAAGGFRGDMPTQLAALYINAQVISAMRLQKQGVNSETVKAFLGLAFSVLV